MVLPLQALGVVGISFVLACLFEASMWLLFYNGGYLRQLSQLDALGKRLDAATAESAADPVRSEVHRPRARLLSHAALCWRSTRSPRAPRSASPPLTRPPPHPPAGSPGTEQQREEEGDAAPRARAAHL